MNCRLQCPLCRSKQGESLFAIDYDSESVLQFLDNFYGDRQSIENRVQVEYLRDEELIIRYCSDCDFYWHEYILDSRGMESLYEEWINAEHSRQKRNDWNRRESNIRKAAYLRSAFKNLKQPENLRVLDLGMGWGGYLQAVRAWGCEVHGVEVSDIRREEASAKNITVYKDIAEVSGEFDVIASHQTFEHIPDPSGTLASLRERLADDGLLHVTTPTASRPVSAETVLTKGAFQPLEHINGFTQDSMVRLMDNHDLTPVSLSEPFLPNPQVGGLRSLAKLGLLLTNTYWLYDRLSSRSKPQFFRPRNFDN